MGDATINNNDNNADKRTEAVAPTSDGAPPNSEPKAEEPNAQTNEEKPNGIEAGQTEGDGEMNVEHDTNEVKPNDVDELPLDAKPRHSISSGAESKDTFAEDYVFECTKRGVVPLGYYIRHMRDSELVMRHADISPEDFRPLAISLSQSKFITKLDLSHNCVSALCQLFSENVFIEHLSLADNRFTDAKTEEMCDTLASVAQLTWLDLSENCFSDESANFFSDLMATSLQLVHLNLSKNKFGEGTAIPFGRGLAQSECLVELDISWNHIRGKGMKQLCQGIAASKLKKLNFAYNGLGPINGCKELTIGIKSNLILEELDLSDNRISPEGAVLLGKGLQVNASLKTLKMDRNPLQSAGCYVILNFIIKNPNKTLKVLTFEDIEVNESFRLLEGQALTALPDLTIVYGPKSRNKELSWYSLSFYVRDPSEPRKYTTVIKKIGRMFHKDFKPFLLRADEDNDMKLSRPEFTQALEVGCD
ncbi:hypothetical protein AAHC03_04674 [Spirometra sp. Aus1]